MNSMLIESSWHKVIYWVVFVQCLWQWLQSGSWPTAVCWMSTVRFGSEVATGWPLCEVGTAPCQTQLLSSGSNRATIGHSWVPQPRWWHLCDSYFRKDKQNFTEGEKGTKRVRKSRGNTKVRGAGVEALEGSGQSHSPWKITWWSRYLLAAHGGPHQSRHPHCSSWTTLCRSRRIFSERPVTHGEPILEQAYHERLQTMQGYAREKCEKRRGRKPL